MAPLDATSGLPTIHIMKRYAFSSALARMSVLTTADGTSLSLLTKGSPEALKPLLAPSSMPEHFDVIAKFHMAKGRCVRNKPPDIAAAANPPARRVLALASKPLSEPFATLKQVPRAELETGLTFAGFLVLDCPIKNDTISVISELTQSKHRCIMITGDAVLTATEVARKVAIMSGGGQDTFELRRDEAGGGFSWHAMDGPAKTVAWAGDGKSLAKLRADGKELCVTGAVLEAFSGAKQGGAKGERVRAKRGSGGQHRAQPENLPASALPSLPR